MNPPSESQAAAPQAEPAGWPASVYRAAIRATYVSLAGNAFLAVLKIICGLLGRSGALVADGVHTATDIASSLAVLVGLSLASKRPDPEHPYGHGRAEAVAGGLVAMVLVSAAALIVWNAAHEIVIVTSQELVKRPPTLLALVVAAVSIAAKELLARFKMSVARKVGSSALEADAWHHRSDALTSVAALIAIAASFFGGPRWAVLDAVGALAIGVILAVVGVRFLWRSGSELMDVMPTADVVEKIRSKAVAVPGVLEVEKVRVRKSGLEFLVDIHVEVDGNIPVEKGHTIARNVKEHLETADIRVRQALVHIEPFVAGDH